MATDSSSSTTIPASFTIPVTEKLTKTNYRLWRAQIMPAICAAHLEDLLTGTDVKPAKTIATKSGDTTANMLNPKYAHWATRDQALLGYLLSSLTCEVLQGITTLDSSTAVWNTLEVMYASHSCARSVNTRIALATTKKGASTMVEYFSKMKAYADEMSAYGQALGDDEFVAYVLIGLDKELHNFLVSSIVPRVELISSAELYS
jgi:uncharacterized membrane protein YjjP (DUF1212 family)